MRMQISISLRGLSLHITSRHVILTISSCIPIEAASDDYVNRGAYPQSAIRRCHIASRFIQPTICLALVGIGQARYEATYSVAILRLRVSKAHDCGVWVLGRSDSHLASVLTFVCGLVLAFGGGAMMNAFDVGVFVDGGLRTAMHTTWPVHQVTPRTSEHPDLCKNNNTTQKSMS